MGSSDTDNSEAECGGGKGKRRKPVLVPKNTPFCHQSCCARFTGLIASMFVLAWLGHLIQEDAKSLQWLGAVLLTAGPSVIILCYFWVRYSFSTTRRQMLVTFVEAIFWMVPLLC